MAAVEHVGDAGEARLHHADRRDAVARAHAGEVEGLLDMVLVAHPAPQAGDLLGRVGEREAHAPLVEAGQGGGGAERTEGRAGALGAAMRAADEVGSERQKQAAAQVVAERHRPDEFGAGIPVPLGERQGRRNGGAAGMGLGHRLEIVGLVRVGAHGVGERRVHRGGPEAGGDDPRLIGAAEGPDIGQRHLARPHPGARDHGGQGIEDPVLAGDQDLRGQVLPPGGRHVARETPGHVRLRGGRREGVPARVRAPAPWMRPRRVGALTRRPAGARSRRRGRP